MSDKRFEKWIKNHRSCTSREIWQAAIQAERERCAKIALLEQVDAEATGTEADRAYNYACEHIAAAIRRGGEHDPNE